MTSSKTQDILDDEIIDLTDIFEEGPGPDSQAKKLFGDLMPQAGAKTSKLTDNADVDALLNDLDSFEGDNSQDLLDNQESAPSQEEVLPVVDITDMDDLFDDLDMPAPGAVAAPVSKPDTPNDNDPLNADDLDGLLSSIDFESKANNLVKEEFDPEAKAPKAPTVNDDLDLDSMLDSMTPKGSKATEDSSFSSLDDLLEASYESISPESKAAAEKVADPEPSLSDTIINLDSFDNEMPAAQGKGKNSSLLEISLDDLLSQDAPVSSQSAGANSPFSFDEIAAAMELSAPTSPKGTAMGRAAQKEHVLGPEVNELPIDALDKVLGGLDDLLQDPSSPEQQVSVGMERILQLEEDIQANAENYAHGLADLEQRLGAIEDALDSSEAPQTLDELDNIFHRLELVETGLVQLTNAKEDKQAGEAAEAATPAVFSQEQDERLRALEATLEEHGSRLAGLESRLSGVDSMLGGLIGKLSSFDTALNSLDVKLSALDTRFSEVQAPIASEALDQRIADLEKAAQSAVSSTMGDSVEHMDSVPMLESAVSDLFMEDGPVRDNFSSFVRGMVLSELMLADNVPPYVEAMAEDLLKLQMDVEAGQEKLRILNVAKDAAPDMQEPLDMEAALVPLKAELLDFLQTTVEKSAAAAAAKVIREEIKNLLLLMADDGQDEEQEELEEEIEAGEEAAREELEVAEAEIFEVQPASSDELFGDLPLDFSDLLTSSTKSEEQDPIIKEAAEAAMATLQREKSPDDVVMDELDALLSAVVEAAPDPGFQKEKA